VIDLAQVQATEARYGGRTESRDRGRKAAAEGRVLDIDAPDRIARRLERLAPGPTVAANVAQPAELVDTDLVVLERLIGTNDLVGAMFLARGAAAARSVARIVIRSRPEVVEGFGTGFLVAPTLLMTNNHVLGDSTTALHSEAEFDFQVGLDGAVGPSVSFALEPGTFFFTDAALDFTVVAVAAHAGGRSLAEFGWNPLIEAEGKIILHELLNIVQHPNGEPKQLAARANRLVDVLEDFLHYETDTAPGSSGSPVFNDQWEVVGLHHSGVPRRDAEGRILSRAGVPWNRSMGEAAIDWIANEGVRVSRICRRLRSLTLSGTQAELRDGLLAAPNPPEAVDVPIPPTPAATAGGTRSSADAYEATITLPLEITVRLASPPTASPSVVSSVPAVVALQPPAPESQDARDALVRLAEARRAPYYDEVADGAARTSYYRGIASDASGEALFRALAELVAATHLTRPRYRPAVELYPAVDLQPDGQLKSIYTGETFAPERLILEDLRTEQRRHQAMELRRAEMALGSEAFTALDEELEAALPFNCEHVVPQSWFEKAEPMRGDLHHLFTCQMECNSFRGNTPFFDFSDFGEVVRQRCGKHEQNRFEPSVGKGEAARATFYFLVRYPGAINRDTTEIEAERLPVLLEWHESFPVSLYERHRNAQIHARQGNRNPFIDNPHWAAKTPLIRGLG
jgi:endonuclease G